MSKRSFMEGLSALLSSQQIKDLLKNVILRALKMQALGGFRGWLVKKLVTEFTEEVLETIKVEVDYIDIKRKMNDTADMQDRGLATDILNDIMK